MIKKEILIGILIVLIFFYLNFCQSKKIKKQNRVIEKFTAANNEIKKKIIEEINNTYKLDLEAIRNLSDVAVKLQKKGLTIPGDLTIKGKLNVREEITSNSLEVKDKIKSKSLKVTDKITTNNVKTVNLTSDYVKTKKLDITNNKSDKTKTKWTRFNDSGKNYLSGHNWIEAKGKVSRNSIKGDLEKFGYKNKDFVYFAKVPVYTASKRFAHETTEDKFSLISVSKRNRYFSAYNYGSQMNQSIPVRGSIN